MRKQTIIVGTAVLLGFVGSFVAQRNWLANEAPPELLAGATTEGDPEFERSLACKIKEACGQAEATLMLASDSALSDDKVPPGYLDCAERTLLPTYGGAGRVDLRTCRSRGP